MQGREWAEVKKTGQRERGGHEREEFKNKQVVRKRKTKGYKNNKR